MKKYLAITIIIFTLILILSGISNSTVLWSENFDAYPDWNCGTSSDPDDVAYCTCPIKTGESLSPYNDCKADVQEWGSISGEASYVIGINSTAGRSGKGFRINLRAHSRAMAYDGENIIQTKPFNTTAHSTVYLRWYQRDSWVNWANSNYQKFFRIWDTTQWSIPYWYDSSPFRVWFRNNTIISYSNVVATANTWHCYEIKYDFANHSIEVWQDDVSKGVQSVPELTTSYIFNNMAIGGNQHNINCWTPFTGYKTRDYDDIVVSTEKVGCTTTPPSSHYVKGTVSGLTNPPMDVRIYTNDNTTTPVETLRITANGTYQFQNAPLVVNETYWVIIYSQPSYQTCSFSLGNNGSSDSFIEMPDYDVTNINIQCSDIPPTYYTVGGTVAGGGGVSWTNGHIGQYIILRNNGGDNLRIDYPTTDFTFDTPLVDGASYTVTDYNSPGLDCYETNATGNIESANVTNVGVSCSPSATGGKFYLDLHAPQSKPNTITFGSGDLTINWNQ